MTDRPPPETVHVPDGPIEAKAPPASADGGLPKFGRFQTTAQLGAGAMGTVYRAHDEMLGRDVAIKSLTSDDGLGTRERFLREARAIGALQHANILAIYDAGAEGATPYLVMELAGEGTLRDRIKAGPVGGPISVETARAAGTHIARALAAAHAANILHRDVKPANILATRDAAGAEVWKLADFGIARLPDSTLTVTGQFIGSPSYAAPESLRAGQFSAASDVYGLAATLYEALCGSPPHGDHDMGSVIRKLEHEAPPLQAKRGDVPGPIGAAIMAGLSRDPAQRPSADQLAQMLADTTGAAPHVSSARVVVPVAVGAPVMAPTSSGPSSRLKLAAIALAAIALVIIIVAATRHDDDAKKQSELGLPTLPTQPASDNPDNRDNPNPDEEQQPTPQFVDQNGNPVDDETAKQLLEQMQRDAEEQLDHPGPGHGHGKKHKH